MKNIWFKSDEQLQREAIEIEAKKEAKRIAKLYPTGEVTSTFQKNLRDVPGLTIFSVCLGISVVVCVIFHFI